jgi:hypothetical protein
MLNDSRNRKLDEIVKWFKVVYTEFLKDNKGYANPLDYVEGVYGGNKDFYAKIARRAGHKCIKRNGVYYFES